MLRLAVLILLLANAGYYAWSQGLLRAYLTRISLPDRVACSR